MGQESLPITLNNTGFCFLKFTLFFLILFRTVMYFWDAFSVAREK